MIEEISVQTWGWIIAFLYIAIVIIIMSIAKDDSCSVVIIGILAIMIAFIAVITIAPYEDEIFSRDLSINDTVITNHYADELFIGTITEMNRGLITVRNKDGIEKLIRAGHLKRI